MASYGVVTYREARSEYNKFDVDVKFSNSQDYERMTTNPIFVKNAKMINARVLMSGINGAALYLNGEFANNLFKATKA